MTNRRQFLTASASALAASAALGAHGKEKPGALFSFGLMADCQFADVKTAGSRHYRESPRKLREAVDAFNGRDLAFSFHLGDFIDRDFASFDVLDPIAAGLRSKLFHALGNHDFDVADEKKEMVPARLKMKNGHYAFRHQGYRFIVIDTTEVSVYRYPEGSEAKRFGAAELKKVKGAGSKAAQPWNGRPGDGQVSWLESELKAATAAKEAVFVFGHHPILPDGGHSIWNAAAVNGLLQRYPCAKLYMNGHNHAGAYTDAGGLHYLTLDGMVETKDTNAFAFADVYPDRLEVTGSGRQESHVLEFR